MGAPRTPDALGSTAQSGAGLKTPRNGQAQSLLGLSHVTKSPNWSFAGKAAPDLDKEVPGPGTYALRSTGIGQTPRLTKGDDRTGFSFGTSARMNLAKTKIPGPGAYTPPSDFGNKLGKPRMPGKSESNPKGERCTMPGRKMDKPTSNSENPAPGSYSVRAFEGRIGDGPSFSAAGKKCEKTDAIQCLPGCGDAQASGGPHHPMCPLNVGSQALRRDPGPGEYDAIASEVTGDRQPRCCFGTAGAAPPANPTQTAGPGPGTYEAPGTYSETPRFTMKARPRQPKVEETPGPGSHGGHYSTLGDYRPAQQRPAPGTAPRTPEPGPVVQKPTATS